MCLLLLLRPCCCSPADANKDAVRNSREEECALCPLAVGVANLQMIGS
jgi:hypothetical protein